MDTISIRINNKPIKIRKLNHYDKEVFARSLLREVLPRAIDVRELPPFVCLEIFNLLWNGRDSQKC